MRIPEMTVAGSKELEKNHMNSKERFYAQHRIEQQQNKRDSHSVGKMEF